MNAALILIAHCLTRSKELQRPYRFSAALENLFGEVNLIHVGLGVNFAGAVPWGGTPRGQGAANGQSRNFVISCGSERLLSARAGVAIFVVTCGSTAPVSYTHLTLPTNREV